MKKEKTTHELHPKSVVREVKWESLKTACAHAFENIYAWVFYGIIWHGVPYNVTYTLLFLCYHVRVAYSAMTLLKMRKISISDCFILILYLKKG